MAIRPRGRRPSVTDRARHERSKHAGRSAFATWSLPQGGSPGTWIDAQAGGRAYGAGAFYPVKGRKRPDVADLRQAPATDRRPEDGNRRAVQSGNETPGSEPACH